MSLLSVSGKFRNPILAPFLASLGVLITLSSCGGGGSQRTSAPPDLSKATTSASDESASKPPETTASPLGSENRLVTITGKITYAGKPKVGKAIDTSNDPACAVAHLDAPLRSETLVQHKDGGVQNVFVYLKSGVPEKAYTPPDEPVVLDQIGCHYVPHVFGIMKNQALEVRNSDATSHNIHALPKTNEEFNFSQPKKGSKDIVRFDKVELMLPIKCDVHSWMKAYGFVMSHPFFDVSDAEGSYTIKDVPPGKYVIQVWHERKKLGKLSEEIDVGETDLASIDFEYK
jgi:hypothetical protein